MEGEYVPEDQRFAVFSGDSTGPIWYGFFSTLEAAKQKAKNLAASDGLEFFRLQASTAIPSRTVLPAKEMNLSQAKAWVRRGWLLFPFSFSGPTHI